jgi:hypothetical protein
MVAFSQYFLLEIETLGFTPVQWHLLFQLFVSIFHEIKLRLVEIYMDPSPIVDRMDNVSSNVVNNGPFITP